MSPLFLCVKTIAHDTHRKKTEVSPKIWQLECVIIDIEMSESDC